MRTQQLERPETALAITLAAATFTQRVAPAAAAVPTAPMAAAAARGSANIWPPCIEVVRKWVPPCCEPA